jgi:hypothetical protein
MKWTTYLKIFVFLIALGSMFTLVYAQKTVQDPIQDIRKQPSINGDRYTYERVDKAQSIREYTDVKPRVVRGDIQKIEYYRNNRKVNPDTTPARGDISVEVTPKIDVGTYTTLPNGVQKGNFGYSIQINPWFNSTWQYRVPITISSSDVSSDLTDFPVYTDISNLPSQFHDNVQSDMCDVRVTKADGSTQLPAERVSYNATADTGELHHKQNLSSSTDTTYYIYWGTSGTTTCPATTATNGRDNVWTSYEAVFHLNDPGDGSSVVDSTGGSADGSLQDGAIFASGSLGEGLDTNGTPTDAGWASTNFETAVTNGDFSISAWVSGDGTFNNYEAIASNRDNSAVAGFLWGSENGGGNWEMLLTGGKKIKSGVSASWQSPTHLVSVVDQGTDVSFYENGSLTSSPSSTTAVDIGSTNGQAMRIGTHNENNRFWDGLIDEVRFGDDLLSSEWVSTEYAIQSDNTNFLNIGTTEVLNEAPSQFNLTSPNGDTFNGKTNVTFNWDSANDVDNDTLSYTVNVYNRSSGNFVTNTTTTNNVTTVDIELTPSNYSWNATVTDGQATNTSVQTYQFDIVDVPNNPPSQFNLTNPNNKTFNGVQDITLNWESANDANNDTLTYTARVYDNNGILVYNQSTTNTETVITNVSVGNYSWNATVTDGQDVNTSVQKYNFIVQKLVSACTNYAQCIDGRQECLQTNDGTNPDTFDRTCTSTNLGSGFLAIMLGVSFVLMFFGWRMRHYQLGVLGSFTGILTSLGIIYINFLYTFVLISIFITTGYLFATNRLQS